MTNLSSPAQTLFPLDLIERKSNLNRENDCVAKATNVFHPTQLLLHQRRCIFHFPPRGRMRCSNMRCKNRANEKHSALVGQQQIEWHGWAREREFPQRPSEPACLLCKWLRPKTAHARSPKSFSHAALLFLHTCLRCSQDKYEVKERRRKSHCMVLLKYLILLPQVRYLGRMVKSGARQPPPAVHSIISVALEPRAVLTLKINSLPVVLQQLTLRSRLYRAGMRGCQRQMALVWRCFAYCRELRLLKYNRHF